MNGQPVRVLVADDSVFMRTALTRMIESDPAMKVIGTASHGLEALQKVVELDPDVVTMDIEMPRLDGLRTLTKIMQDSPRPVIVVSALSQEGADSVLNAFDLGAFDCLGKPRTADHLEIMRIRAELLSKVRAAAASTPTYRVQRAPKPQPAPPPPVKIESECENPPQVIAIGSSTGGPRALQVILSQLPADLPAGILIVQHMPVGFTGPFARRLDQLCKLNVREAEPDDVVEPGVVLVAPAGKHLTVRRRNSNGASIRLTETSYDTYHIPSVDVMMNSVADVYGGNAMGVILTGMGADGARGLKAIRDRGGYTVGQDESTCAVWGMPRSATNIGAVCRTLPLDQIGHEIAAACDELAVR